MQAESAPTSAVVNVKQASLLHVSGTAISEDTAFSTHASHSSQTSSPPALRWVPTYRAPNAPLRATPAKPMLRALRAEQVVTCARPNSSPELQSAPAASATSSLGELYASESRALVQLASGITRNRADAEDVVQSAFVNALRRGHALSQQQLRGWLRTVVRHLAIDSVRRGSRWKDAQIDVATIVHPELDPRERTRLSFAGLDKALESALPALRATFELWYHGASYVDISRRLGVPFQTVASRVFRAKAYIRKIYGSHEALCSFQPQTKALIDD